MLISPLHHPSLSFSCPPYPPCSYLPPFLPSYLPLSHSRPPSLYTPLHHSYRFLISAPLPWAYTGSGEMTHAALTAVKAIQSLLSKQGASTLPSDPSSSSSSSLVLGHQNLLNQHLNSPHHTAPHTTPHSTHPATRFALPRDLSTWTNSTARRTPIFVINLDRRPDR